MAKVNIAFFTLLFFLFSFNTHADENYDISNLPAELTSQTLIPFPKNAEEKWRSKFLSDNRSNYMSVDCQTVAYPYLRAAKYWYDIDSEMKIVNQSNGNSTDLTRESAAKVCADASQKAAYRQSVLGHPAGAFDRMCELLNAPTSFEGNNLTINYQTVCIDTNYIASSEYESCMKTQNRTTLKTTGLSFTDYCKCSGDEMAKVFKSGERPINSKTLVSTATSSRLKCDSPQKPFSDVKSKTIPSENKASTQSNDTVESLSGKAEEIVDETTSTLKDKLKGLGGLFKK